MRSRIGVGIALPLIVLAILIGVRPGRGRAHSAVMKPITFTVTNASDCAAPGCGSLRDAINQANATPGADNITFDEAVTGTITLTMGELPPITDDLTITGPGVFALTVDGNHASRIFEINGVTVNISGLTISNGGPTAGSDGGGILNNGTLTLDSVALSGNSATGTGQGGGISNGVEATLTINNSTLSGNSAKNGGGIANGAGGSLTITGSTLSSNSATNGSGGGIYNINSTLTILNSTLSGNSATVSGGGLYNATTGTANISFTTMSGNSATTGGGIFNAPTATINIKNSIVANSTSGGDCANSGTWNATGKNFTTNGTCPGFTQVASTGAGGLNLGPLADNGGLTKTHALQPNSVAIDAAPDCFDVFGNPMRPSTPADLVTIDQRGVPRPQGSACDVGAYEFVPCTTQPSITCPEDFTRPTDTDKCTAKVDYTPATANCPCANAATKPSVPKQNDTCTVSCTPPPGSTFNKGPNTVTCTVTDAFGNTNQCSFTITVVDMQPPTVNCPQNITKNTDPGKCSTTATYTATANDNCDGPLTPTCNPPSGSTFQKGTTTVTCMATDSSGNTGSCTFTVTVVDNEKPQFPNGCPNNVTTVGTASCPINTTGNVANFTTPTATDNCPGVTVACVPPSGSVFPPGTTTVTCTATDTSGNTATCTFSIATFSFCLQDETNPGNFDLISPTTGDYSFFCNGVQIASGRGTLNVKGCQGSIEHQKGDRRVFMEWDTVGAGGKGAGTAIVQVGVNNTKCQITDKDMSNNTCAAPQAAAPVSRKPRKAQN